MTNHEIRLEAEPGTYLLQVQTETEMKTIPIVKIN